MNSLFKGKWSNNWKLIHHKCVGNCFYEILQLLNLENKSQIQMLLSSRNLMNCFTLKSNPWKNPVCNPRGGWARMSSTSTGGGWKARGQNSSRPCSCTRTCKRWRNSYLGSIRPSLTGTPWFYPIVHPLTWIHASYWSRQIKFLPLIWMIILT